ncbi:MAG: peptide deformylase [Beijerinckiaceae bacterium]
MALRKILVIPEPQLRRASEPVVEIDNDVLSLADDMLETMYDAPGIGLAAIQIGVARRIVVMDLARKEEPNDPMVFINPEIISFSEERSVYEEGCLSIPEYYEEVERPERVTFRYLDRAGKSLEREVDGLFAVCIQHEIDHLNGKLFIDHISKLKRDRVLKKFQKLAKRDE